MAQRKLTDDHKLHIGECYASGVWTQDRLAELYEVSRKTIYRVLLDLGLLKAKENVLSPGSARIVELVRSLGLDEHSLYQALNQPVLSRDNMVALLARMELKDIESLFADAVQHKHLANHGTIPDESQLAAHPDA